MSSYKSPAEAITAHKEAIKKQQEERRLADATEKAKRKEEHEKEAQHTKYIYSLKPATKFMNNIAASIEDPSNEASSLICDHIAETGKDDNIYIYGSIITFDHTGRDGIFSHIPARKSTGFRL